MAIIAALGRFLPLVPFTVTLADSNGTPSATITPDSEFQDAELAGWTTIFGRLLRVGGSPRPTAQIQLSSGRKLTASVDSEVLAAALGRALYSDVSLEGQAIWPGPEMRLVEFKITKVGPFGETADILESLQELSIVAGDFWDDIDPDDYIRNLRSE